MFHQSPIPDSSSSTALANILLQPMVVSLNENNEELLSGGSKSAQEDLKSIMNSVKSINTMVHEVGHAHGLGH